MRAMADLPEGTHLAYIVFHEAWYRGVAPGRQTFPVAHW
jgi:hypothetical protein